MPERDALQALSIAEIRRRFANSQMPLDPLNVDLTDMRNLLSESALKSLTANLRAAAVLIPVIERAGDLTVLLTERSAHLKHHAGQVSFPGGGMESQDEDIARTALRETDEELGIKPDEIEVGGFLAPTLTITGFSVTPVIGFVDNRFQLVIDPCEVASTFEVPLDFLLDSRNETHSERTFQGSVFPVTSFHYDGHQIWGATAVMLLNLRKYLILHVNQ